MAEIEITSPVMTEEAGQAIASAISTMSSTSVGNLSALTTTDKTSLVGAVNEVKSGLTNITPIKVTGHTHATQGMATWNDSGIDFTGRYVVAFYIITEADNTPYYVGQGIEGISVSVNPTTNKPQLYVHGTADAMWKDADCFAILV